MSCISSKLLTSFHLRHRSSACIDPEVKMSKVKVTIAWLLLPAWPGTALLRFPVSTELTAPWSDQVCRGCDQSDKGARRVVLIGRNYGKLGRSRAQSLPMNRRFKRISTPPYVARNLEYCPPDSED